MTIRTIPLLLLILAAACLPTHAQQYTNPIVHADYSDPDACAVGDDFYMTASSFNGSPGLPILHSTDLVHWTLVNHALPHVPNNDFNGRVQHGRCVWAPSIRHHNGEFYIYYGDPDHGIYMVKAADPRGAWSKPILVKAGKGIIDPCPLWDDDGRAYIVHAWAASRARINSALVVCEMNAEGTQVVSQPVLVYDGTYDKVWDGQSCNHTVEGPKLYKRNGYYYILAPAGGVAQGWQLALRARNILGPYESRVVMAQGASGVNGPHQGAWVETAAGESWFLHFQEKQPYGRILHLQPMAWRNDWCVIGEDKDGDGCGTPVGAFRMPVAAATGTVTPQASDEFSSPALGLQWEWHANPQDIFGFPSSMGYARVYSHPLDTSAVNLWNVPNLLLQKFPSETFTATARMKVVAKADGNRSGLLVMGWDYCFLALEKQGDRFELLQVTCKDAEQGGREATTTVASLPPSAKYNTGATWSHECDIELRVAVSEGGLCKFSYSTDGRHFRPAGAPFQAREGKWIGAKVGLASVTPAATERGWLDCDWFRVKP